MTGHPRGRGGHRQEEGARDVPGRGSVESQLPLEPDAPGLALARLVTRFGSGVTVTGLDGDAVGIVLSLYGPTVGTWTNSTPPGISAAIGHFEELWSANGAQGSGTIIVTSSTAIGVAGTFSFTAPISPLSPTGQGSPPRVVTDGHFDVRD